MAGFHCRNVTSKGWYGVSVAFSTCSLQVGLYPRAAQAWRATSLGPVKRTWWPQEVPWRSQPATAEEAGASGPTVLWARAFLGVYSQPLGWVGTGASCREVPTAASGVALRSGTGSKGPGSVLLNHSCRTSRGPPPGRARALGQQESTLPGFWRPEPKTRCWQGWTLLRAEGAPTLTLQLRAGLPVIRCLHIICPCVCLCPNLSFMRTQSLDGSSLWGPHPDYLTVFPLSHSQRYLG